MIDVLLLGLLYVVAVSISVLVGVLAAAVVMTLLWLAFRGARAVGLVLLLAALLPPAATWAEDATRLELRVAPRMSVADPQKAVYVMGAIIGPEVEAWYCPAWELWLNGERMERWEADCPPYEERTEFPRRRIYTIARVEGNHSAEVVLYKAGKTLARQSVTWEVH